MGKPKESAKAIRKYLGEPYPAEFSPSAEKVRRNLLTGCAIAFILLQGNLKLSASSTILGLKFENLTTELFYGALLIFVLYQLFHFSWHVWDTFAYWRVRLTGVRVRFQTVTRFSGGDFGDGPDDPRQSSLNHWWLEQTKDMEAVERLVANIEQKMSSGELLLSNDPGKPSEFEANFTSLRTTLEKTEKVVTNSRVPESLKSFENWYTLMVASQSMRWLIVEAGIPMVAGAVATVWLFRAVT